MKNALSNIFIEENHAITHTYGWNDIGPGGNRAVRVVPATDPRHPRVAAEDVRQPFAADADGVEYEHPDGGIHTAPR